MALRLLPVGLLIIFLALAGAPADAADNYADPATWLCRPGAADACTADLTATVVPADGPKSFIEAHPASAAPIDCFYVYPTVSREPSANADMTATQAEAVVARNQFARFRTVCRLFAPLYRAVTLAGLKGGGDTALAYGDAVDAWHYYLAHDNGGRGVVLIGHSQGAFILKRLIAAEIDGKPLAARFVGAILPGGGVDVAGGRDVGGSFSSIPLCRAAGQTGCVIAYSTFPAGAAGAVGPFGLGSEAGRTGACVDPAALDGQQTFDAYLPVLGQGTGHATIDTPFYTMPGLLSGHCVTEGDRTYLAVSVGPGPRAENAKRFLAWAEDKFPGWGLHAIDINLVIGNLVDLVAQQSKTWVARHGAR